MARKVQLHDMQTGDPVYPYTMAECVITPSGNNMADIDQKAQSIERSATAIEETLEEIAGSDDIPAATVAKVAQHSAELSELASEVDELQNVIGGFVTKEDTIEIKESGKYFGYGGGTKVSIIESANTFYSKPIFVKANCKYTLNIRGYNANFWVIVSTDATGTAYVGKVQSQGTTLRAYEYTPTEDGYIAVSGYTTYEYSLSHIEGSEPITDRIDEISERVDEVDEKYNSAIYGGRGEIDEPITIKESGKYFSYGGVDKLNISSSANTFYSTPIEVKQGDHLVLTIRAYNKNFWVLATTNVDGSSYVGKVQSEDSTLRDYEYDVTEDGYIAVSGYTTFEYSLKRTTGTSGLVERVTTLEAKVDDLVVDSAINNHLAFAGIPKVGIIGDSLASGVTYKSDNTPTTNYDKAWWNVLKRDSGMEYLYFAEGGLHTRSWFTRPIGWTKANTSGNECCAYIIGLGVNDQYLLGESYLGTIADIKTDYTQNADTYYGNYAKIIQSLTAKIPNAKFFLLTVPRNTGLYPMFNEAIRAIADKFSNAYLVDLERDYISYYQSGYIKAQEFGGAHYSASAYQVMGTLMEFAISKVMTEHANDFRYIQFALDSIVV